MILYFVPVVLTLLAWTRRYKPPCYSTQKQSRNCKYFRKSPVMPLQVPWKIKMNQYTPEQLNNSNEFSFWWFRNCNIDGKVRLLAEVSPFMFSLVPFNPLGRTGACGKGLFPNYGPNKLILTLVWSRTFGFLRVVYLKRGEFLYAGYVDHPMNTDNAWYEAEFYSLVVDEPSSSMCREHHGNEEWLNIFIKMLDKST